MFDLLVLLVTLMLSISGLNGSQVDTFATIEISKPAETEEITIMIFSNEDGRKVDQLNCKSGELWGLYYFSEPASPSLGTYCNVELQESQVAQVFVDGAPVVCASSFIPNEVADTCDPLV